MEKIEFEECIQPLRRRKPQYAYLLFVFFERYAVWAAILGLLFYTNHIRRLLVAEDEYNNQRIVEIDQNTADLRRHIMNDATELQKLYGIQSQVLFLLSSKCPGGK